MPSGTISILVHLTPLLTLGTIGIVVCPTRELAMQTYGVLVDLMQFCSQKHALVRGGGVKKDEAKLLFWGQYQAFNLIFNEFVCIISKGFTVDVQCMSIAFLYMLFI